MRPTLLTMALMAAVACSEGEKAGSGGGDMPDGTAVDLGGILIYPPDAWVTETPSSAMRKAQYALPAQAGDAEGAQLVVFNFGPGTAGSARANLDRWYGQIVQPDGSPSGQKAIESDKTVDGMNVTLTDVSGTYSQASGPMMRPGTPKPNSRMLAAIVESSGGAYYFKVTGPEATVAHWKPAFDRFIESVRAK